MFDRVLIANRGEIAVRIERTLARLGVESVAVYSDADAEAPHVRGADLAVHIGPTPARDSYLSIERVVDAAQRSGASAVHPGYGFLSERPDFAAACTDAGLVFVGPGPEAMAMLGDKGRARAVADAAGVPTLAGWSGDELSDAEILERVAEGDLPLLVKAAAGGGGKGMRLVERREDLAEALGAARREAAAAFGDERVLIERFVEPSRHLEIQVIADAHGNAIHLGERECSLQRRHQKVIEESPSPVVGEELREAMGAAAVALARQAGYVNAGTVELIAERDDPSSFYFLEVNTRLQVEHPVTEEVTGLDLVELQLRVAAGEPLPLSQDEVTRSGWAIEARIYAEDPAAGFLPSSGEVVAYREAPGGPGRQRHRRGDRGRHRLRPDAGQGDRHGGRSRRGLGATAAGARRDGGRRPDHERRLPARRCSARPEVRAGEVDTGLIERLGDEVAAPIAPPELAALALVALLGEPEDDDIWSDRSGWRMQGPVWIRQTLESSDGPMEVAVRAVADRTEPPSIADAIAIRSAIEGGSVRGARGGDDPRSGARGGDGSGAGVRGAWAWEIGDDSGVLTFDGTHLGIAGTAATNVDGPKTPAMVEFSAHQRRVWVYADGDGVWVVDPDVGPVRFAPVVGDADSAAGGEALLEAPMPGTVVQLRVEPGATVAAGETLVVMESMKMEISIQSPRDGVIDTVLVAAGDQVDRGAVLIELVEEGVVVLSSPIG